MRHFSIFITFKLLFILWSWHLLLLANCVVLICWLLCCWLLMNCLALYTLLVLFMYLFKFDLRFSFQVRGSFDTHCLPIRFLFDCTLRLFSVWNSHLLTIRLFWLTCILILNHWFKLNCILYTIISLLSYFPPFVAGCSTYSFDLYSYLWCLSNVCIVIIQTN